MLNEKLLLVASGNPYGKVVWEGEGVAEFAFGSVATVYSYELAPNSGNPIAIVMRMHTGQPRLDIVYAGSMYSVCSINGLIFTPADFLPFEDFITAHNNSDVYIEIYSGEA